MKRFYMINYLLCGICLLWMTGCSNMLDEMRPKDKIPQDALSESDLTKLLNGVYAEMEELVFKFYMDGDVKGENFKAGPGFSMNDPMSMAPSSKEVLGQWQKCFTALKQVNFLVETYEASSNKDSQVVKQTGGTGYYFRALIYYHLVTRWGGAPILRKRTYDVVPISPEADVWNFIKEDLGKAESLLPEFTDRFYVSLSVCDALNAKVCLALKDYTNAAIYADRVITKSNFALSTTSAEYANAFISNSNSKELILLWPINAARDCYFSISLLMILTRHGIILPLPIAIVIFMPILQSKSRIFVPKQSLGQIIAGSSNFRMEAPGSL